MPRKKEWREGEMILTFHLNQIIDRETPTMQEWLAVEPPVFNAVEQHIFDNTYQKGLKKMQYWTEENLKMQFISPVLELGMLLNSDNFVSFFDKALTGEYEGYKLSVKTDFVIGSGLLDYMKTPLFHFQEYKPQLNPTGDPMAQLLEAFLIGQAQNKNDKPIYGCEIIGGRWRFVTMEGKSYCISKPYDCIVRKDLLQIIAILRKFKDILETRLLD